ncbi:MAG TPA: hypothetical protein VL689_11830 [Paraburkholderia sp.]|nr:hypothetical protein [Paraburkholderia sp.]
MPHEFGIAYFWAARSTASNGTVTIRLKGMCRGMYDMNGGPGWLYRSCAAQLRDAQREFARELGGVGQGRPDERNAMPVPRAGTPDGSPPAN